tara:strand:+ start:530 stop:823 length:294 start_codon:yes stop_codon:yes gene_type:complete
LPILLSQTFQCRWLQRKQKKEWQEPFFLLQSLSQGDVYLFLSVNTSGSALTAYLYGGHKDRVFTNINKKRADLGKNRAFLVKNQKHTIFTIFSNLFR